MRELMGPPGTGCNSPGYRDLPLRPGLVERSTQASRELHGVVVRPEVHEEEPGLFSQHMTVQRGDLNAVLPQCTNDRIHLARTHDEVPGDRGSAATSGL